MGTVDTSSASAWCVETIAGEVALATTIGAMSADEVVGSIAQDIAVAAKNSVTVGCIIGPRIYQRFPRARPVPGGKK
jgi:hypothetical protein